MQHPFLGGRSAASYLRKQIVPPWTPLSGAPLPHAILPSGAAPAQPIDEARVASHAGGRMIAEEAAAAAAVASPFVPEELELLWGDHANLSIAQQPVLR